MLIGLKDLQRTLLKEVSASKSCPGEGRCSHLAVLVPQYHEALALVEREMDEEIARVRVVLMDRLAKREAIGESLVRRQIFIRRIWLYRSHF